MQFRQLLREYTWVLPPYLSFTICMVPNAFFTSLTSVLTSDLPLGSVGLGLVLSAFFLGILIGSAVTERQIKQVGHIRAYSAYITITASSVILLIYFQQPLVWFCVRFICGYCLAGTFVVIEGWLLALSKKTNRGTLLSIYTFLWYLSTSSGQYFLHIIDLQSFTPFVIISVLMSLSTLPVLILAKKPPEIIIAPAIKMRKIIAKTPISVSGCFFAGVSWAVLVAYGPIYAQYSSLDVATVMSTIIIGGSFLPVIFGRFSDLVDRRYVLLFMCATCIPILIIAPLWIDNVYLRTVAYMYIGGVQSALYPICISRLIDYTEEEYVLNATGVALVFFGIGSTLGPNLMTLVARYLTPASFLPFLAVLLGLFLLMLLFSIFTSYKAKQQAEFIAVTSTSLMTNEIDPRT